MDYNYKVEKPLIVILGPTASGKSEITIKLAQKFSGEIISADSRTIYKLMDIGTAKPSPKEQLIVPHHLIDVKTPNQKFSVAEFQKLALKIITKIHQKGKIPFLVGGTGLYIDAVCEGFQIPKPKANLVLRQKLAQKSLAALLKNLKKIDFKTYQKIDKKNKRRIIRALEVSIESGKPFSQNYKKKKLDFEILKIGIKISRSKLYQGINQRLDQMLKKGLIREVKNLLEKDYAESEPLKGLVYKDIKNYLAGKIILSEAVESAKKETRNFAKRQITWFKRDKKIHWVKNYQEAENKILKFLEGQGVKNAPN